MSAQLLSSKIAIVEEQPSVRPIQAQPTSVAGGAGVTERGPFGPTLTTSFEEYLRVFGGYTTNSDLALAAKGFFENAGNGFFWVSRVVHYTDPTNPASKTSAQASTMLLTANLVAQAGTERASIVGPYSLVPGDTLAIAVDGGGPTTITFTAVAPHRDSAVGPYALVNGQTLTLALNGGAVQTIIFTTSEFVAIGAATAAEVAAAINGSLVGGSATVVGGAVRITTDKQGTAASINVTGGTANGALAFTVGLLAGTGNVGDITAVTAAEVVAAIVVVGLTPTVDTGAPRITSNTTGNASSVQTQVAGTATTKIGFDTAVHSGNNAGTLSTLRVQGKTDGAYGNAVGVIVGAATSGDAASFNFTIQQSGRTVEVFPNVTMDATKPNYVVSTVNDASKGSNLVVLTDQFAATSAPNNRPVNVTQTMTGGGDGLVGLADADFIGSQVANSAFGTGLRAFDSVPDLSLLLVPGQATAAIHNAMITYCEATRFGSVFAILDPPAGQSATQIVTYVTSTAAISELSEFGAFYWPRVKIANPNTTVFGTATTLTVAPSGLIAGRYAANDANTPGGVYEAPAGIDFGKLLGVVGLETDEVKDETKRDLVQPKHINPIVGLPGLPIHIDGADTLKSTGPFPTVGERRGVIFIEQSLKSGLVFAKHRKIKTALLSQINRSIRAFLVIQMRNDAFATNDPKTAFLVDTSPGLNPPSEAFAKRVNARIGLATAKPAEFIILRVGQDLRALEEELAAAA